MGSLVNSTMIDGEFKLESEVDLWAVSSKVLPKPICKEANKAQIKRARKNDKPNCFNFFLFLQLISSVIYFMYGKNWDVLIAYGLWVGESMSWQEYDESVSDLNIKYFGY